MNKYMIEKQRAKNALKLWFIFGPIWLVSFLVMFFADDISENFFVNTILRAAPFIAIVIWGLLPQKWDLNTPRT